MSMVQNSNRSAEKLVAVLQSEGIRDARVLQAIMATPRQLFVDGALTHKAYHNTALPIGQGQTISQPYIVARMSELLLQDRQPQRVLEIGTGSGYQTAILSQLVPEVMSVERIQSLQYQARRRFRQLDLHNIALRYGDGWEGWPSKGPYDGIIVTAAAASIPNQLLHQLKDGGRLVIPVGESDQELKVIDRMGDRYVSQNIEAVRFVPLIQGGTQ